MRDTQMHDEILLHQTSLPDSRRPRTPILVFFLTGNPGLIEYYRDFLTAVIQSPDLQRDGLTYYVAGRSLRGFETGACDQSDVPLNLRQQISVTHQRLHQAVANLRSNLRPGDHWPDDFVLPVILIGHSVGTYMILEILASRLQQSRQASQFSQSLTRGDAGPIEAHSIVGAINLFPTIVDLSRSPTGSRARLLARLPGLSLLVHLVARCLCLVLPDTQLVRLISRITGQPQQAARVTAAFLRSATGVRQAVYMAQFELTEMMADEWSDELWGVTEDAQHVTAEHPRIVFYWAANDHWVANSTRDTVIARRAWTPKDGKKSCKPIMEVDTMEIGHDFCIHNSKPVATKVVKFINDIVDSSKWRTR